ncbi:MAG TPA: SDR family NAD(P)-dependent oxidoreductase [Pseudomonadota bacterium]|nr:SDR family NAD(P)-dependent oxidoreductase [Pseudomonadota bacterium]
MSILSPSVAVVTGANRGIGAEIARQLAHKGFLVFVGCRQLHDGDVVASSIRAAGGQARALALDVSDPASILAAVESVSAQVGQIDALVNNAGIALEGFNLDIVRRTLAVNFYGAERATFAFLPLLARQGKVVMVSSGMADRSALGPSLRARFSTPLSRAELHALLADFEQSVATGQHRAHGWPQSAYRVSKLALNVLCETLSRELADDPRDLVINACCPGWVKTDMGGPSADRSVEEGADTPVWLATLPADGPRGGFFRDRAVASW